MLKHSHYIKSLIFVTACTSGRYGQDCTEMCGNCAGGAVCDHVDGTCSVGCDPGWQGGTCKQGQLAKLIII